MPPSLPDSDQPTSEPEGAEGMHDGDGSDESGTEDRDGSVDPEAEEGDEDGHEDDHDSDEASVEGRNGLIDLEAQEDEDGFDEQDDGEDESDDEAQNGFFDLEAEEDEGGSDEDDQSDDVPVSFPQFSRLPIELRYRIWDFFDASMKSPVRVFDFKLVADPETLVVMESWQSATLEQQTAPARAVLATHRESRALALKYYPDEVPFRGGRASLRCKKTRDIFYMECTGMSTSDPGWSAEVDTLENVQHIALDLADLPPGLMPDDEFLAEMCEGLFVVHPGLRTIFQVSEIPGHMLNMRQMAWSARPDVAQRFYVRSEEEEYGVGEDIEYMYCWPKCATDANGPAIEQFTDKLLSSEGPCVADIEDMPCKVFPMIKYSGSGIRTYDRIQAAVLDGMTDAEVAANVDFGDDDFGSGQEDQDEEENEYESSGIDDATIDGSDEEEEEEDDLVVQQSSPNGSTFGGFSPLEGEMDDDDDDDDDDDGGANLQATAGAFSSPEPDSPREAQDDDDEDDDNDEDVAPSKGRAQRPARRVVHDSDDSDGHGGSDSESDPAPRVPPAARRGRAVVDSDDDDEDSEEGDEDDDDVVSRKKRTSSRRAKVVHSSDDDGDEDESEEEDGEESDGEEEEEEDDEDESEDEEKPPKKLSLAERLQLFRSENPLDPDDESAGSNGEDGEGAEVYGAFQDDDEGDGEMGGDDYGDDNLVMDMAEEDEEGYDDDGEGEGGEW